MVDKSLDGVFSHYSNNRSLSSGTQIYSPNHSISHLIMQIYAHVDITLRSSTCSSNWNFDGFPFPKKH